MVKQLAWNGSSEEHPCRERSIISFSFFKFQFSYKTHFDIAVKYNLLAFLKSLIVNL